MSTIFPFGRAIGKIYSKSTDKIIQKVDNFFKETATDSAAEISDGRIKVKLAGLSTIWLKYNNTFLADEIQKKKQAQKKTFA
jgi:hypothetical protein